MFQPVKVRIQNYQSIEDIKFEVAGFTTITGKTNIGKSAIMRALSGALLNKPVVNLVRTGAKSCSVQLSSEQWGLLWEKAEKGLNRYTIDGKAERLENVGQRQPEPVSVMGFSSVRIGDRDLYPWYASQWTPVFLLDEGGPTVTQFISEISGLDVLQNAISLSLKGKKKALDGLKSASSEAEKLRAKLEKIGKLNEFTTMVKELDSQAESILQYEVRISRGSVLLEEIETALASIDTLDPVQDISVPQNGMGDKIALTLSMNRRLFKLEEAAKAVIALHGKSADVPEPPKMEHGVWAKIQKYAGVDKLKSSVAALEPVAKVLLPPHPNQAEINRLKKAGAIRAQIDKLKKSVSALSSKMAIPVSPNSADIAKVVKGKVVLSEMEKARSDIDQLNLALCQINPDLNDVLEELKKIPSCPTCSRPLASSHSHAAGGSTGAAGAG